MACIQLSSTDARCSQDRIAVAIGTSEPTLRKHYKRDILIGATEIDAQAVATLVGAMRSGGKEAVVAAKWWTQSRMGWSESLIVDGGKPADTPMRVIVELVGEVAAPHVEPSAPRFGLSDTIRKNVQLVG
jgi:hypothetical protein